MKFAVLAFIISCCLVAVHTKATGEVNLSKEADFVRCIIHELKEIEQVTTELIKSIHKCGSAANATVKELIANLEAILKIIKELKEIYLKDCKECKHHGITCTRNITKKVTELLKVLERINILIKEIKNAPKGACKDVSVAIKRFGHYFACLPDKLKACKKA